MPSRYRRQAARQPRTQGTSSRDGSPSARRKTGNARQRWRLSQDLTPQGASAGGRSRCSTKLPIRSIGRRWIVLVDGDRHPIAAHEGRRRDLPPSHREPSRHRGSRGHPKTPLPAIEQKLYQDARQAPPFRAGKDSASRAGLGMPRSPGSLLSSANRIVFLARGTRRAEGLATMGASTGCVRKHSPGCARLGRLRPRSTEVATVGPCGAVAGDGDGAAALHPGG